MLVSNLRRIYLLLAFVSSAAIIAPSSAHADRCDDLAAQLKNQIDDLKVGIKAANMIYLSHPNAREMSLGCAGRNYKNELFAKADSRKPKPAFIDLVAGAAAIVFTLPKDDTSRGASRCLGRMGLLRGDKVTMRYRRLDMECTRTKTDATIAISRGADE